MLLAGLARRVGAPYPVFLALGGTVLAFVPGAPSLTVPPELALALARGERPEPRLGDFREGVVMTRFFSDLSLTENGDGTLKPLAPAE